MSVRRYANSFGGSGVVVPAVERIQISGKTLLMPDSTPIGTADGYPMRGENYATWGKNIATDGATAAAEGQTVIRHVFRFRGLYGDPSTDSYDPAEPTLLKPANVTQFLNECDMFISNGVWVQPALDTNCGQSGVQNDAGYTYCLYGASASLWPQGRNLFTDAAFQAEHRAIWRYLASLFVSRNRIFGYELCTEPMIAGESEGPGSPVYANDWGPEWIPNLLAMYRALIAEIRTVDTITPFVVGPRKDLKISLIAEALLAERSDVIYTANCLSFTARERVTFPRDIGYAVSMRDTSNVPVWIQSLGTQRFEDADGAATRAAMSLCNSLGVSWAHWVRHQNTADPTKYSTDLPDGAGGYTLKQPEADIVRYYTNQNLNDLETAAVAAMTAEAAEFLYIKDDFSNVYQTNDTSTPVTAMAQSLGLLTAVVGTLTLSATGTARPTVNPAARTIDQRPVMWFNGSANILSGSSAFFASGDDMTIIIAGTPADLGSVQQFLHVGTSATNPRYPFINASAAKVPNVGYRGDDTTLVQATGSMNTNDRPMVLAVTKSGNNVTLYVQGISEATSTAAIGAVASLTRMRVGGNTTGGNLFNGPIAGLALKRGVMTTAHIVDVMRFLGYVLGAAVAV